MDYKGKSFLRKDIDQAFTIAEKATTGFCTLTVEQNADPDHFPFYRTKALVAREHRVFVAAFRIYDT